MEHSREGGETDFWGALVDVRSATDTPTGPQRQGSFMSFEDDSVSQETDSITGKKALEQRQ